MVIRVTKTKFDARLSDVIHVEFGVDWCCNGDRSHLADHCCKNWDFKNQQHLACEVHNLEYLCMTWCDNTVLCCEFRVGRVLVEGINPAIADGESSNFNFSVVRE
jgi:hypothetical protein